METILSFTREEHGRCDECRGDGTLLDRQPCMNCNGTGGADNEYECTAKVWVTAGTPRRFDASFGNWLPGEPEEFQLISMYRNDTMEEVTEEKGDYEMLVSTFIGQRELEKEPWN